MWTQSSAGLSVGHFLTLIETSYRNLHEMFVRTYGLLYEQNAEIFVDLFVSLKSDYLAVARQHRHRGNTDSADTDTDTDGDVRRSLDRFFVVLMRRMLTLLNRYRSPPSDEFLHCVSSHIHELKPFGDVPSKLSVQLHRAFIAARAFVVGLSTGADVISTLSKVCDCEHPWLMCLGNSCSFLAIARISWLVAYGSRLIWLYFSVS